MSDRVRLSAAGPSRTTLIALHAGPARGSGSHFSPGWKTTGRTIPISINNLQPLVSLVHSACPRLGHWELWPGGYLCPFPTMVFLNVSEAGRLLLEALFSLGGIQKVQKFSPQLGLLYPHS